MYRWKTKQTGCNYPKQHRGSLDEIKLRLPFHCSQHQLCAQWGFFWPGKSQTKPSTQRNSGHTVPLAHRPAAYHYTDGTKDGRKWPVVTSRLGTRWRQDPTSIWGKHVEMWIIHVFCGWLYIHTCKAYQLCKLNLPFSDNATNVFPKKKPTPLRIALNIGFNSRFC